jgi:hypothetical protein
LASNLRALRWFPMAFHEVFAGATAWTILTVALAGIAVVTK